MNRIDTVCLINPNNPNGGYVPSADMRKLLEAFSDLKLVILDESFVDFAYEDEQRSRRSLAVEAAEMPQVMLIKSMSKDFGIAGLRAGYALMTPERVQALLSNGFLWNISGLCEFLFGSSPSRSFNKSTHWRDCATSTRRATSSWSLGEIESLRAYPTKANFVSSSSTPRWRSRCSRRFS